MTVCNQPWIFINFNCNIIGGRPDKEVIKFVVAKFLKLLFGFRLASTSSASMLDVSDTLL